MYFYRRTFFILENMGIMKIIARYEWRLLGRSQIFWFVGCISFISVILLHFFFQSNFVFESPWPLVGLPCAVPFLCAYFLNFAQLFFVLFVTGNFWYDDRRVDSTSVLLVRPEGNGEYVLGKLLGTLGRVVCFDGIVLLMAILIHVFASSAPFDLYYYFFYLFILLLPSLFFLLGMVFFIKSLIRIQGIALILLIGIFSILFYLSGKELWIFDFMGHYIPNVFSEVTGGREQGFFLVQRLYIFLVGLSLCTLSVANMERLPNWNYCHRKMYVAGGIFGGLALLAVIGVFCSFHENIKTRSFYSACQEKYEKTPEVRVVSHDIELRRAGDSLYMKSHLVLVNEGKYPCSTFTFYLNPGLRVDSLWEGCQQVAFLREGQILSIDRRLCAGDSVSLQLEYSGKIDERICYLDVADDVYSSFKVFPGGLPYRFARCYAYVGDDFMLLTPESIWYPVTSPPVVTSRDVVMRGMYFTRYTLRVVGEKDRVVISQGKCLREKDSRLFDAGHALPALSVCMGNYERKYLKDAGTLYEIYCFKGHDFFSAHFKGKKAVREMIDFQKYNNLGLRGGELPLERLALVETPFSFYAYSRLGQLGSEYVQPEILFYPEWGVELEYFNIENMKRRDKNEPWYDETECEMNVLNTLVGLGLVCDIRGERVHNMILSQMNYKYNTREFVANKRSCLPLFFTYVNFIKSDSFPAFNTVLYMMRGDNNEDVESGVFEQGGYSPAVSYLSENSLSEAIQDSLLSYDVLFEVLRLKSRELKEYILAHVAQDEFIDFFEDFFRKTRYQNVDYEVFNYELKNRFGIDLGNYVRKWYHTKEIPLFSVNEIGVESDIENGVFYLNGKVWNRSNVDGVITVYFRVGRAGNFFNEIRRLVVPGGTCERIRFAYSHELEEVNGSCKVVVATNFSLNVPKIYEWKAKVEDIGTTRDTTIGLFKLEDSCRAVNMYEYVVDNRDLGFRLYEKGMKPFALRVFRGEKDYLGLLSGEIVSSWQSVAFKEFYGDALRDAHYRTATGNGACAEWNVFLPEAGCYEVFVYNVPEFARQAMIFAEMGSNFLQRYVIYHEKGMSDFELLSGEKANGWVSVGKYYFPAGDAKVVLSDKGGFPGQYIFADAMKWVRVSGDL